MLYELLRFLNIALAAVIAIAQVVRMRDRWHLLAADLRLRGAAMTGWCISVIYGSLEIVYNPDSQSRVIIVSLSLLLGVVALVLPERYQQIPRPRRRPDQGPDDH